MSKKIMGLRDWLTLASGLLGAIWWALEPYMRTGHFDLATDYIDIVKAVGLAIFSYVINYALKQRQQKPSTNTTDNGKTTTKECAGGANDGCDTHSNDSAAQL